MIWDEIHTFKEKEQLWDLLGIQYASGISPNPLPSELRDRLQLSPNPNPSLSESRYQLKNGIWQLAVDDSINLNLWKNIGFSMPVTMTKMVFNPFWAEPYPEPSPPAKAQRETPAIGFRSWNVEIECDGDGEPNKAILSAIAMDVEWNGREVTKFSCSSVNHQKPDGACGCGLYAYHEIDEVDGGGVVGAIIAWGRILEHEDGFRAEFARPIALSVEPNADWAERLTAQKAAELLALPFVPYKNLAAYAREFGERLNGPPEQGRNPSAVATND